MKNKIILGIIIVAVGAATGWFLTADKATSVETASENALDSSSEVASTPDGALAQASESEAATAWDNLQVALQELQTKVRSARTPDEQMSALQEIEGRLIAFASDYSGTSQAYEARLHAGIINVQTQNSKKAKKLLVDYIKGGPADNRPNMAYAHYYLAQAAKGTGDFDMAEKHLKIVGGEFGDIDSRLTQMVQQEIAGLSSERKLAVGQPIMPFEVTGIDGSKISPDKYKGKVLLIDFWATWCGPCVAEMPTVKKVYSKYKDDGFEIVGISLDRDRKALDAYLKQNKIPWPQYFDGKYWQNDIAMRYSVSSIPATFLVDRDGNIRYKSLRGNQLERRVKELLAESS